MMWVCICSEWVKNTRRYFNLSKCEIANLSFTDIYWMELWFGVKMKKSKREREREQRVGTSANHLQHQPLTLAPLNAAVIWFRLSSTWSLISRIWSSSLSLPQFVVEYLPSRSPFDACRWRKTPLRCAEERRRKKRSEPEGFKILKQRKELPVSSEFQKGHSSVQIKWIVARILMCATMKRFVHVGSLMSCIDWREKQSIPLLANRLLGWSCWTLRCTALKCVRARSFPNPNGNVIFNVNCGIANETGAPNVLSNPSAIHIPLIKLVGFVRGTKDRPGHTSVLCNEFGWQ